MAKKYQTSLSEQKIFQNSAFIQHEEVKKNIIILPELQSLIPPPAEEEKNQLETNILKEGCREALLVWPTTESVIYANSESQKPVYILVDGHNRFGICKTHNVDFSIHIVNYNTLEEVKSFMIDNQLGRRNLSTEQASYLRGMKYLHLRQNKGKYERSEHKDQNGLYAQAQVTSPHKDHFGPYGREDKKQTTAEQLAAEFNVGQTTIKRDAEFAQGLEMLDPQLKSAVLSGKTKIAKNTIQQLAKTVAIQKPLASLDEIDSYLNPKKAPVKTPNTQSEEALINEMGLLVGKLKNPKKRKENCEKLIALISRLQALT